MGTSQTPKPLGAQPDGHGQGPGEARSTGVNPAGGDLEKPNEVNENVANQEALQATALGPEAASEPWLGRILDDRYRIVRKLGQGGMGAVFVAEHLALRKEVAIKVIRAELAGNGELAVRFAREAMATAQFEHPHVASAIDYGGLEEGGAYFVMQLVKGRSLRSLLRQHGALPWRQVCSLGAQVADALSAARAAGIVHRDLKPDNILVELREDGSELVKILDFGIAQLTTTPSESVEGAHVGKTLTRVGTVMGTPGYMSPEQSVGDKVDHRSDLYSLGVVLWECVSGKELWTGEDVMAIITRQIKEDAPPLRAVVEDKGLPEDLDLLVQQLLARKPDERPDMAGDVRDMLKALALMPAGTWEAEAPKAGRVSDVMKAGLSEAQRRGQTLWTRARTAFDAQPRERQRLITGVAAGLLALVLVVALSGGEGEVAPGALPTPEANPQLAASEADSAADEGDDETQPEGKGAQAAEPAGVIERVVEAAAEAVKLPSKAVKAVAPEPSIPAELEADVKEMLEGNRVRDRRPAARRILKHEPQTALPAYVVAIAKLEATGGCRPRRKALEQIAELGDGRTLDSVARYHDAPKSGCGFLNLADCYACIRRDLAKTMRALEKAE